MGVSLRNNTPLDVKGSRPFRFEGILTGKLFGYYNFYRERYPGVRCKTCKEMVLWVYAKLGTNILIKLIKIRNKYTNKGLFTDNLIKYFIVYFIKNTNIYSYRYSSSQKVCFNDSFSVNCLNIVIRRLILFC